MRLLEKLVAKLGEYGVYCDVVNKYANDTLADKRIVSDQEVMLDFSEHDKKVAEEKDAQIRELKRQIEDLEAIIADGKKPDVSISKNGVSIGCECGGYHLAKQKIKELERDLKECKDELIAVRKNRDEMLEGFRNGIKPYVDLCQMHERIAELEKENNSLK